MDLVGQLGVPVGVFLEGRPLAPAEPLDEFLGQAIQEGVIRRRAREGMGDRPSQKFSNPPGIRTRISLSRFKART